MLDYHNKSRNYYHDGVFGVHVVSMVGWLGHENRTNIPGGILFDVGWVEDDLWKVEALVW
jgi:hypothetical protein